MQLNPLVFLIHTSYLTIYKPSNRRATTKLGLHMTSTPSPQDKIDEFLLARIAALETIVMLLWNEHPNRGDVRSAAKTIFEAEASNDLASLSGDIPVDIRAQANQFVFERVFSELLSGSEQVELRSRQGRSDKGL